MTPDEIRAKLAARKMKVVSHVKHPEGHFPYETYMVIYKENGITKLAHIDSPYYYLSGPDVLANYDGCGYWYKSRKMMAYLNEGYSHAIRQMAAHQDHDYELLYLPDFDPSLLELS